MRRSTMLLLAASVCLLDQGLIVFRETPAATGMFEKDEVDMHSVLHLQSILSPEVLVDHTPKDKMQRRTYGNSTLTFDDLKLKQVVGTGYINYGFFAEHRKTKEPLMVKVSGDRLSMYSVIERDILEKLNKPPTIQNIPTMLMSIHAMPNPFSHRKMRYFTQELRMPENWAEQLMGYQTVDIIVVPLLKNRAKRKTLADCRQMMRSILEALEFAHSRNIMNCDLHQTNVFWDGTTASLFDWNSGVEFRPNSVPIHIEGESEHMIPPEGRDNATAVHQTLSGFDIFSFGQAAKHWLRPFLKEKASRSGDPEKDRESSHTEMENDSSLPDDKEVEEAREFISLCLTSDPFQRPNATELLKHPFLT